MGDKVKVYLIDIEMEVREVVFKDSGSVAHVVFFVPRQGGPKRHLCVGLTTALCWGVGVL